MNWFKMFPTGILRGSLSHTDIYTQLVWVKLLAVASETRLRDGHLRFAVGKPMTMEYLAIQCDCPIKFMQEALDAFQKDISPDGTPRIQLNSDGSYFISNWALYQNKLAKAKKPPMPEKQKLGMTRSLINQNPEFSGDVLANDFGNKYEVLDTSTGNIKANKNKMIKEKVDEK